MKEKIFKWLFLRVVPHRTAIGLVMLVASSILGAFVSPEVCDAMPKVCEFSKKGIEVLAPWLVIAGIRDAGRK